MRGVAFLALVTAGAWAVLAADAPQDTSPDRVKKLIDRLGSGAFRERETASRELNTLGPAAIDALREAVRIGDPETRRRASEILERINDRLAIARILLPTMVEFHFKDKPLPEAVAELGRKVGGTIGLHDQNPGKFRSRKVTASTPGPMPYFEAIELFCRKADLHEWDGFTTIPGLAMPVQTTSGLVQGQVIIRSTRGIRNANPSSYHTVLLDGPGGPLPAYHAGAVRIRALLSTTQFPNHTTASDELVLPLQVSAEPKLAWHGASDFRIDRAIDENGQPLTALPLMPMIPGDEDDLIFVNGMVMTRPAQRAGQIGVRVKRTDRQSKRIAELSGNVAAQVRVTEPMLHVDSPLKAANQTFHGVNDVKLRILSVNQPTDGDVSFLVELQLPLEVQLAAGGIGPVGNVVVQRAVVVGAAAKMREATPPLPAATEFLGLSLEDAQGQRYSMVRGNQENTRFAPDGYTYQFQVTYRPQAKDRVPTKLTFTASRPATVEVPFVLKDVPMQ